MPEAGEQSEQQRPVSVASGSVGQVGSKSQTQAAQLANWFEGSVEFQRCVCRAVLSVLIVSVAASYILMGLRI